MSDFYIVPPRLIVGSLQRSNVVTSLNTLKGDLSFKVSPDTGLTLNINSGVFNLSIQPDFYIKKSGDIVPSNIIFQPDPGKYGLAVGSGLTDPSVGISGALFFNTTYSVLKVYDGSTWNEIASTGTSGITQSFADNRYLRLDGGNTPTGAISMGSQFLRFANLTTRTLAGTAGQVYFNTDTNKLDLYNGSSWIPVGSGITQITAGNGISLSNNPITTYGSVAVNESYNFNWTGTHTHSQPITFSASQTFDASKLTIAYEVAGDLLKFDGVNWVRLPKGSPHQILSVACCSDDLEYVSLVAGSGISITYASGQAIFSSTGGSGGTTIISGTGNSVFIGINPPTYTVNAGDLWYNSENGALNIYYTDIDTSQWVEINSAFGGVDPPANFGIGITQINNIGSSAQFLYAGFSGNTFNISSTGNSHTFNIPIAGVGITGLVSGIAQTIGGIKTFQNGLISGNGITVLGSLYLPNQPLSSIYGGTGKTLYNLGDILVGAGTSFISLTAGPNRYVLQSHTSYASGLGWTYLSNVNVSETAPTPALTGDLWWNSIDGSLSVYFIDVDSTAQWVEVGNAPSSSIGTSVISGITYLNGLYDSAQFITVGVGNSFYIASSGSTHEINIPLAGSGSTGLMSGTAQTFSGNKTFQNDVLVSGMLNFTFATIGTAGITTSPSIAFIGQTNNPITLNVLPDNSLSFDSASGQLFKISNDLLADYIYSVNDVSGLPILRAKSDSTLSMAEYGSNVGIGLSNPSYKLQVSGDAYSTTLKTAKGFIETVYGFGTTSGTITPNWNNGSTQTMTLNNNLTLNAPISMPVGSSMQLVITQDVSGSRLLSPNGAYKFLGGINTLSTAGNSIDIINVFYDGTNYLSELKKGYS
jgi:hypothetical protein